MVLLVEKKEWVLKEPNKMFWRKKPKITVDNLMEELISYNRTHNERFRLLEEEVARIKKVLQIMIKK